MLPVHDLREDKFMDIRKYNSDAWNLEVQNGNPWTIPVSADVIARARTGEWSVSLASKAAPRDWFPPLPGLKVLCLASGGGQQGPVLAAAGATVTVLDNSPKQLERDREVANREKLNISTVEGDMADLSAFSNDTFDLVFHPVSNCFIADVKPVWREAFRVLKPGGTLLAGFLNPIVYQFDPDLESEQRVLQVKYAQPYSDLHTLNDIERLRYTKSHAPLEFGHTLNDQIGGQLVAGFSLIGFYESDSGAGEVSDAFLPRYFATRAVKPR